MARRKQTTPADERHAGGRPSKYDPSMCDRVVALMKEGASKAEICAELDVCDQTMRNWAEEHPEFLEAVKRGLRFSQAYWEREGRQNLHNKEFNSTLWYMNMKNRFGWADKQETKVTGDLSINNLPDEKLESRILELAGKAGIDLAAGGKGEAQG